MNIIKRLVLFPLAMLIIFGCQSKSEIAQERISEYLENKNLDHLYLNTVISTRDQNDEPINIKEIKDLNFLTTTSGVTPASETQNFCKPLKNGFYGFYHLFKKADNYQMMGILTIFTSDDPENWSFESTNEELIQLELETGDIRLWDSVNVGMKKSDLLNFIGNRFHYQKGSTLYAEIGDYGSNFTIFSDTVNRIKIFKICEK